MEIDKLRQELNDLLENIVDHSENYSKNRPIPSLEVSYVLSKVNKMQETLIVLKFLLKEEELNSKRRRAEQRAKPSPEISAPVVDEPAQIKQEVQATISNEAPAQEVQPVEIQQETEGRSAKPNMEKMPIAKLVDAFTLNDRYLYANELFDKDMNAFNEFVKGLDACSSQDEANAMLSKYAMDHNWEQDSVHVESFGELVERRFL